MAKSNRNPSPVLTPKDIERFWAKVDKSGGPDACWLWKGTMSNMGYGKFYLSRRLYLAHRIALWIVNGEFDRALSVCHSCDNPRCVNPSHLFLGTHKKNMEDRNHKLRQVHGESVHTSRLRADDVRAIRLAHQNGQSQWSLAKQFGVTQGSIFAIVHRRSWAHLDREVA